MTSRQAGQNISWNLRRIGERLVVDVGHLEDGLEKVAGRDVERVMFKIQVISDVLGMARPSYRVSPNPMQNDFTEPDARARMIARTVELSMPPDR